MPESLKYQDILDPYSEHSCENYEVIDSWQSCSSLPLVNGLWGSEAEDLLEILYCQTRIDS